jgi:hypothetical protein
MSKEEKTLSLADFNLSKSCDTPFEFEYIKGSTGKGSGLFLNVVGKDSDRAKVWSRKALNKLRQRDAVLAKKNRDNVRPVEDDEEFSNEMVANRIVGWRGIADAYSEANALLLVSSNSEIREQVLAASDETGNFT